MRRRTHRPRPFYTPGLAVGGYPGVTTGLGPHRGRRPSRRRTRKSILGSVRCEGPPAAGSPLVAGSPRFSFRFSFHLPTCQAAGYCSPFPAGVRQGHPLGHLLEGLGAYGRVTPSQESRRVTRPGNFGRVTRPGSWAGTFGRVTPSQESRRGHPSGRGHQWLGTLWRRLR